MSLETHGMGMLVRPEGGVTTIMWLVTRVGLGAGDRGGEGGGGRHWPGVGGTGRNVDGEGRRRRVGPVHPDH